MTSVPIRAAFSTMPSSAIALMVAPAAAVRKRMTRVRQPTRVGPVGEGLGDRGT